MLNHVFRCRKHQSSASLAFVNGIRLWPVDSPHERPVTRKMFPFEVVIMYEIYPLESFFFWFTQTSDKNIDIYVDTWEYWNVLHLLSFDQSDIHCWPRVRNILFGGINYPDSKVHGANMGPTWDRQDPGGSHVGPMNFAIRVGTTCGWYNFMCYWKC